MPLAFVECTMCLWHTHEHNNTWNWQTCIHLDMRQSWSRGSGTSHWCFRDPLCAGKCTDLFPPTMQLYVENTSPVTGFVCAVLILGAATNKTHGFIWVKTFQNLTCNIISYTVCPALAAGLWSTTTKWRWNSHWRQYLCHTNRLKALLTSDFA